MRGLLLALVVLLPLTCSASWNVGGAASKEEAFENSQNLDVQLKLVGAQLPDGTVAPPDGIRKIFDDWKMYFKKSYKTVEEEETAFETFWSNMEDVVKINNDFSISFWATGNAFSDKKFDELKETLLMTILWSDEDEGTPSGSRKSRRSRKLAQDSDDGYYPPPEIYNAYYPPPNGLVGFNIPDGGIPDGGIPDGGIPDGIIKGGRPIFPECDDSLPAEEQPESCQAYGDDPELAASVPPYRNWIEEGAVTAVKEQKNCGSCWAFAATSVIESAYIIATGAKAADIDFSEQNLVSCAFGDGYWSQGCKGGYSDEAIDYVAAKLQVPEGYMPYKSGLTVDRGICEQKLIDEAALKNNVVKLSSKSKFVHPMRSVNALLAAVYAQPVTVYMEVTGEFVQYSGGIYDSNICQSRVNHAMVIIGYDREEGYWLIRNSWGPQWGENGNIKVVMREDGTGECGMYLGSYYPEIGFAKVLQADVKPPRKPSSKPLSPPPRKPFVPRLPPSPPTEPMKPNKPRSPRPPTRPRSPPSPRTPTKRREFKKGGKKNGGKDKDQGGNTPDTETIDPGCSNNHPNCQGWAAENFCTDPRYVSYLRENCKLACGTC